MTIVVTRGCQQAFSGKIRESEEPMSDIAYQNKDITSKILAENFKEKSLKVYGLNVPKIVKVLPTNLPEISANELRIDNIFILEDGSVAIIDYESAYKEENKIKYLSYITRILARYQKEGLLKDITLKMIVIYTADVMREDTEDTLDVGCIRLTIESAYLSELDSKSIKQALDKKVNSGQPLSEEELMQFIILPLTYKGRKAQKEAVKDAVSMAKKIKDESQMVFVLSGIVVFSDKVIDEETSKMVKGWIRMTKVGRLYEEEKRQAVTEAVTETTKKCNEEAIGIFATYLRKNDKSLSTEKAKEMAREIFMKGTIA